MSSKPKPIPDPGPLLLAPVFLPKVWAAREFEHPLAAVLAPPAQTGEIWLASDRHSITPVHEGPLKGMGLDQVAAQWPGWVLGDEAASGLPILVKLLNTGDWLSVQVHPDDAAARLEGEPWGKSECWLVLAAQDGAEIVLGLTPGMDREGLERAIAKADLAPALAKVPARAGDSFHLSAGTVHATGPGLIIFELQQASDVTYRFYDWDRPGDDGQLRELHLDKALEVMASDGPGAAARPKVLEKSPNQISLLVDDPHFSLLQCRLTETYHPFAGKGHVRHVFVLQGNGELSSGDGSFAARPLAPGQSWLIPAGLKEWFIQPGPQGVTFMESIG